MEKFSSMEEVFFFWDVIDLKGFNCFFQLESNRWSDGLEREVDVRERERE